MFPNVNAELARRGWTYETLAEKMGSPYTMQTVRSRLLGKTEMRLSDAKKIKEAFGVEMTLEELFSTEAA